MTTLAKVVNLRKGYFFESENHFGLSIYWEFLKYGRFQKNHLWLHKNPISLDESDFVNPAMFIVHLLS